MRCILEFPSNKNAFFPQFRIVQGLYHIGWDIGRSVLTSPRSLGAPLKTEICRIFEFQNIGQGMRHFAGTVLGC